MNVVKLFPKLRRLGRLPTADEVAARWRECKTERIHAAIAACEWAYTHRQSRTHSDGTPRIMNHPANLGRYGSCVLGCRLGIEADDRFVLSTGANFKLRPGEGDLIQFHPIHDYKMCSEPEAVISAISFPVKCWWVHGLTLFSDNMQAEDVSGLFCNIQHPCADCREFLSKFLREESPVTLVRHLMPCDNLVAGGYVPGPDGQPLMTEIDRDQHGRPILIEEWTFGRICSYHQHMKGRRSVRI